MRAKAKIIIASTILVGAAGVAIFVLWTQKPPALPRASSPTAETVAPEREEPFPSPPEGAKRTLSDTCVIGQDDKMYSSTDIDGDGMYDSDEIRWFGTLAYDSHTFMSAPRIDQPLSPWSPWPDSDRDGLADEWEMGYFGTLDLCGDDDPDGDGFPNSVEMLRRSSPLEMDIVDSGSQPKVLSRVSRRKGEFSTDTQEFWSAQEKVRNHLRATGSRQVRPQADVNFRWDPQARLSPISSSSVAKELAAHRQMQDTRMPLNNKTDSDGDGLPDEWERKYFGNLRYGRNDDPDGDGFPNIVEYYRLTSPARQDMLPDERRPPVLRTFRDSTHRWAINWDISSREFWQMQERLVASQQDKQ